MDTCPHASWNVYQHVSTGWRDQFGQWGAAQSAAERTGPLPCGCRKSPNLQQNHAAKELESDSNSRGKTLYFHSGPCMIRSIKHVPVGACVSSSVGEARCPIRPSPRSGHPLTDSVLD